MVLVCRFQVASGAWCMWPSRRVGSYRYILECVVEVAGRCLGGVVSRRGAVLPLM